MIFQFRCLLTVLYLSNNQSIVYIILQAKYVCLRWPCPSNEQWFILKSGYHSIDTVRKWDEWNLEFMNPSLSAKQVPGSYTGNKCIAAFPIHAIWDKSNAKQVHRTGTLAFCDWSLIRSGSESSPRQALSMEGTGRPAGAKHVSSAAAMTAPAGARVAKR